MVCQKLKINNSEAGTYIYHNILCFRKLSIIITVSSLTLPEFVRLVFTALSTTHHVLNSFNITAILVQNMLDTRQYKKSLTSFVLIARQHIYQHCTSVLYRLKMQRMKTLNNNGLYDSKRFKSVI